MASTPERWLVAAWPGLGQVATTAAVYLLSKLRMHQVAEFTALEPEPGFSGRCRCRNRAANARTFDFAGRDEGPFNRGAFF